MKQQNLSQVDHSAIKFSQLMTMLLLLIAFILNSWFLAAMVGVINLLGAMVRPLSLFGLIYRHLVRPSGLVKPDVVPDFPEPHRFAQGFSGLVTILSALLVWSGVPVIGWVLSWLVIVLANLNIFVGFCAGCFTYFQLSRLGLPGFKASKG